MFPPRGGPQTISTVLGVPVESVLRRERFEFDLGHVVLGVLSILGLDPTSSLLRGEYANFSIELIFDSSGRKAGILSGSCLR